MLIQKVTATYSQMHNYSQHSSIIWPGKSRCRHLNFKYRSCFEQGVPWHSGNYRPWIHSKTRTRHDRNIQSNALHRYILAKQLNPVTKLAKWLSFHLRTVEQLNVDEQLEAAHSFPRDKNLLVSETAAIFCFDF